MVRVQKIERYHQKFRGCHSTFVKDEFTAILKKLGRQKLWKKSCLGSDDRSISERNLKSKEQLVFEIFGFKLKIWKCLKNCNILYWRFRKSNGNFERTEIAKNLKGSKSTKKSTLLNFENQRKKVKIFKVGSIEQFVVILPKIPEKILGQRFRRREYTNLTYCQDKTDFGRWHII